MPWSIGSHGRPIYIDIKKFGSLRAKLDSVGSVILELHKSSKVPPRMVNLLDDDESDKEVEINVMKALRIDPADTSTREAPFRSSEGCFPSSGFVGIGCFYHSCGDRSRC